MQGNPVLPKAAPAENVAQDAVLEYPHDDVKLSRNSRPVVLLHGTLVDKDGISAYRDFALRNGHPVNHRTYSTIQKGARIEESTELASQQVNLSRAEIAGRNVEALSSLDRTALAKALSLDGNLYGSPDPDDTVAPKAIVVGHSAGGYAAYTLAVNPEPAPDNDPFTYDGGNGVGEVVVLSSPIKSGLPKPAPSGVADLPFYNYESKVLRPLEKLPPARLVLANPVADFAYSTTKNLLKSASRLGFMAAATLTNPMTHLLRPGNAQVEEGSAFFRDYVESKEIPAGTTVIAVTSPLDNLSQEERSKLDTEQTNGHTLSIDLEVSEEDLQRERPTWAHVIMTEKPDSFKRQFEKHLRDDPEALVRLLDTRNDDGVRHEALTMVARQLEQEPVRLSQKAELKRALQKVADERLPFSDSPSYVAYQILKKTVT